MYIIPLYYGQLAAQVAARFGSIPTVSTRNILKMSIEQLFFELLRVSIGVSGCLSKTPTNEEWKALYDMAKKQSLVGVCFAGVQMLVNQHQEPPEMLYLTWMGMAAKIQQRNEVVNQQCEEVQKMLAEKGFRSCIFKGQAVASLYHSSLSALR